MEHTLFQCHRCRNELPLELVNTGILFECAECGASEQVHVFPALFRANETASTAGAQVIGEESSCFYHPKKRAEVPCETCGRFLCGLCAIEVRGKSICPQCLERQEKQPGSQSLQTERLRYDALALFVAVVPIIFTVFTIITAPVALYLAIKHWRMPPGLTPKSRWMAIVAATIASAEIAFWGYLLLLGIASLSG